MKRTLTTIALTTVLGLSLTACGGGNGKFESVEDARQAIAEAGFSCEGTSWTVGSDGKSGACQDGPHIALFDTEAELENALRHYETVIVGELDMGRPQLIRGKNWYMTPGAGNTEKLLAGVNGRVIGPDEPLVELD